MKKILNHITAHLKDILRWSEQSSPQGSLCVCLWGLHVRPDPVVLCVFLTGNGGYIWLHFPGKYLSVLPFVLNAEWWHLQKIIPSEETVSVVLLSFCWWQSRHREPEMVLFSFKQPLFQGEMRLFACWCWLRDVCVTIRIEKMQPSY